MSELGDALRRHPTPGGEEIPAHVVAAAIDAGRAGAAAKRERPRWMSGPAAIIAALVLALPAGYAIAEQVQSGGPDAAEVEAIIQTDAEQAALDAMLLDAAQRAEAGELKADVDQARAAVILREALDPPSETAAANKLEDEMIALTETLRASGDLPQIGGDFQRTWGSIPPSVIGGIEGEPVGVDPSTCPGVVAAFGRAGLEPPTVYSDACPNAQGLADDIERAQLMESRRPDDGSVGTTAWPW